MGYYISITESKFSIRADQKEGALKALRALASQPSYAWVEKDWAQRPTLAKTLEDWRWELLEDESGNVTGICFTGQKQGDDAEMFNAIAPFVDPGSFIEVIGEDGYRWRWAFNKGEEGICLEEQWADVFWGGNMKSALTDLLNSEDDTGCSDDLTVVSKEAIETIRNLLKENS